MNRSAIFLFVLFAVGGTAWVQAPAQVDNLQERVERGLSRLGTQIQEGWTEVRQSVDRMGLTGRVYARLHWDKALQDAALEIEAQEGQVVVLKGSVSSGAAKERAVQLAQDTVGVKRVVDRLAILENTSDASP